MSLFKIHSSLALLAAIMVIGGCGGTKQVTADAQVLISPASTNVAIDSDGPCQPILSDYRDELVVVRILDASGGPIVNAEITVSLDWAANTSSSVAMELYNDTDGDLVPDPSELVSGPDDPLFVTETGSAAGEKNMIVRMNLSCTYRGTLTVAAQAAVGTAEFSVTAGATEGGT